MRHKIKIDSNENLQRLIEAASAELLKRQVQVVSGTVLSLFGTYCDENDGILPVVNIHLKHTYQDSDRELLLTMRAEVERILAHFTASPICCGMVGPNSFSGVGHGMDYLSMVTPSDPKASLGTILAQEMNCHHMANYLLRCTNGLLKLAEHAHKCAGLLYEPQILEFRAIPLASHPTRKVQIEVQVPEGVTISHPVAKLWFTDTFFNSTFIRKVAALYKFTIRKA